MSLFDVILLLFFILDNYKRFIFNIWSIPLFPNIEMKKFLVCALDCYENHRPSDTVQKYNNE